MEITIHGIKYTGIKKGEFDFIQNDKLLPMKIRKDVGDIDREIAFLREVGFGHIFLNYGMKYGDYVIKNLEGCWNSMYYCDNPTELPPNVSAKNVIFRVEQGREFPEDMIDDYLVILCDEEMKLEGFETYLFHKRYLYISTRYHEEFKKNFHYYISGHQFNYDNLINLCIMVKNAGKGFRDVLKQNLPYVDYWTFLDTGSTDDTVKIIKEVMKDKRGELHQEPFINFRDSRNRLLDLARNRCVFNVMLDDTYVLKGDLRDFLTQVRGDDLADSFNLFITENDTMYGSNRITKSNRKLRYRYTIHEIIEPNMCLQIPKKYAYISDIPSNYMKVRTKQRKQLDLKLLTDEIKQNPSDPRPYYYMAETYLCLDDWKNAEIWYKKRAAMGGYSEEKQDALYKRAVMNHLHLRKPWAQCHEQYIQAYRFSPERPEGLFMIGYHYALLDKCDDLAYMYLKKAFQIGFPPKEHGMNLKIEMYNFNIPKYLLPLCYKYKNYQLGEEAGRKAIAFREDQNIRQWLGMFYLINQSALHQRQNKVNYSGKPLVVWVMAGGWNDWYGETLRTKGIGGSETCMIRFSETIVKNHGYDVVCFCKCGGKKMYNGVTYFPLEEYAQFLATYNVKVSFVNRYPEYCPVTFYNNVPCYLILHDLVREKEIILDDEYLKGVICLTNWHKEHLIENFPIFKNKTHVMSYGIEVDEFPEEKIEPFSFYLFFLSSERVILVAEIMAQYCQKISSSPFTCIFRY